MAGRDALARPGLGIHSRAVRASSSSSGAGAIKPAYLIVGTDEGKIDAALTRLRTRAEREGGPGALESFGSGEGSPDTEALIAAIPSMSLMSERRYLVADGVERWTAKQASVVGGALAGLPPDLTVALVARESPPRVRAPKDLADAVADAGGEVLRYDAPKARELPSRLVAEARGRGFRLDPDAARLLVERVGESTMRLATEIERLSVWAGPDGEVVASAVAFLLSEVEPSSRPVPAHPGVPRRVP